MQNDFFITGRSAVWEFSPHNSVFPLLLWFEGLPFCGWPDKFLEWFQFEISPGKHSLNNYFLDAEASLAPTPGSRSISYTFRFSQSLTSIGVGRQNGLKSVIYIQLGRKNSSKMAEKVLNFLIGWNPFKSGERLKPKAIPWFGGMLADCPAMSVVFVCWHSRKWWPPIRGGTLQPALLRQEKVKWTNYFGKKSISHTNCRWKSKKQDKKRAKTL